MKKILTLSLVGLVIFFVSCTSKSSEDTTYSETTTENLSAQINELSNDYNIALFVVEDLATSIGINFELPEDTNGYVDYKPLGDPEYSRIKAAKKIREFGVEEAYLYEATLTNLIPGMTYEYRIASENDTILGETHTFNTLAADQESYSLMFLPDPQENSTSGYMAYAYSVMSVMEYIETNIELVMIPGDLIDNHDVRTQWNQFFRYSSMYSFDTPLAAAFGNHEMPAIYDETVNLTEFDGYTNLPNNGPIYGNFNELSGDARLHTFDNGKTYSFDFGMAHIVVIDSEMYCDGTLSCTNYDTDNLEILQDWLRNDLNNSDSDWKIVMLHRGPYGLSYDTDSVRENLVPVLEECGVDLVLAGHEHQYSRAVYWQGDMISFSRSDDYLWGDITLTSSVQSPWNFNSYSRNLGITYLTSNTTSTKYYGLTTDSGIPVNYGFRGEYPVIPIITVTADSINVISYAILKESGLSIIPTGVAILEEFNITK